MQGRQCRKVFQRSDSLAFTRSHTFPQVYTWERRRVHVFIVVMIGRHSFCHVSAAVRTDIKDCRENIRRNPCGIITIVGVQQPREIHHFDKVSVQFARDVWKIRSKRIRKIECSLIRKKVTLRWTDVIWDCPRSHEIQTDPTSRKQTPKFWFW